MAKNRNGFTTFEIVLALVIIFVIGVVSWRVMNANHPEAINTSSEPSTKNQLLSYDSPIEKFTIKYPYSWHKSSKPDANHFPEGLEPDTIEYGSFTNPTGVTLYYTISKNLPPTLHSKQILYPQSIKSDNKGLRNAHIYFVTYSGGGGNASLSEEMHQAVGISQLSPAQQRNTNSFPYYQAVNNPGYAVRWSTFQQQALEGSLEVIYKYKDFSGRDDVQKAVKILKSLSY